MRLSSLQREGEVLRSDTVDRGGVGSHLGDAKRCCSAGAEERAVSYSQLRPPNSVRKYNRQLHLKLILIAYSAVALK